MAFTFFFRDRQTLDTIVTHLLPVISGQRNIQIWDAGCATGEEPYSLAILLAERMGRFAFKNLKIYATDINKDFENIIQQGIYPYERLQRIPREIFQKYFEPLNQQPDQYQLVYSIRNKMIFQLHDLRYLKPIEENNSLIICKNVLLHQKPEERIEILKMFHKSLKPNGLLALEQTQMLPKKVEHLFLPVVQNAQLFQKKQP